MFHELAQPQLNQIYNQIMLVGLVVYEHGKIYLKEVFGLMELQMVWVRILIKILIHLQIILGLS